MNEFKELVTVRVNINLTAASLQSIVENAKKISGCDEKGVYRVDTAEWVNKLVSRFLFEYDFEGYAKIMENYTSSNFQKK
jgi:hypothetical protein